MGRISIGWLYWYFWIIVVPVEAIAGARSCTLAAAAAGWEIGTGLMAPHDLRESHVGPRLRRV